MRAELASILAVAVVAVLAIGMLVWPSSEGSLTGLVASETGKANLVATAPAIAPSSPYVGSPVLVRFLILNTGSADAIIDFDFDDGEALSTEDTPVSSRIPACDYGDTLAPRKVCWVQKKLVYDSKGAKMISVTLDSANVQDESRENDNLRTKRFAVREARAADAPTTPVVCRQVAISCTAVGQTGCTLDSADGALRCNKVGSECTGTCAAVGNAPLGDISNQNAVLTAGPIATANNPSAGITIALKSAAATVHTNIVSLESQLGGTYVANSDPKQITAAVSWPKYEYNAGSGWKEITPGKGLIGWGVLPDEAVNKQIQLRAKTNVFSVNQIESAPVSYTTQLPPVSVTLGALPATVTGKSTVTVPLSATITSSDPSYAANAVVEYWARDPKYMITWIKLNVPQSKGEPITWTIPPYPNEGDTSSFSPDGELMIIATVRVYKDSFGGDTTGQNNPDSYLYRIASQPKLVTFNRNAVTAGGTCGNGRVDAGEQCDGTAFQTPSSSCATNWPQTWSSGSLQCTTNCMIDDSSCVAKPPSYSNANCDASRIGQSCNLVDGTALGFTCSWGMTGGHCCPITAYQWDGTKCVSPNTCGGINQKKCDTGPACSTMAGATTLTETNGYCCISGRSWNGQECALPTTCTAPGVAPTPAKPCCEGTAVGGLCNGCSANRELFEGTCYDKCPAGQTRSATTKVCTGVITTTCGGIGQMPCSGATSCDATIRVDGTPLTVESATGRCCPFTQKFVGGSCSCRNGQVWSSDGVGFACLDPVAGAPAPGNTACIVAGQTATGTATCCANLIKSANNVCTACTGATVPNPAGTACVALQSTPPPTSGPVEEAAKLADLIGTADLAKYKAPASTTGAFGETPMANGNCASGLVKVSERGLDVCRYPAVASGLAPLLVQYRSCSQATATSDGAKCSPISYATNAMQAMKPWYGAGGECSYVTSSPNSFGKAIAQGLVPATYEGYETFSAWLCQSNLKQDQWYSAGRAKWLASGMPATVDTQILTSAGGASVSGVTLSRAQGTGSQGSTDGVDWSQWVRASATVTKGSGPVSMAVAISGMGTIQFPSRTVSACKAVATAGRVTPVTLDQPLSAPGAIDAVLSGNTATFTIVNPPTAPRTITWYKIYCTDAQGTDADVAKRKADPYAWRYLGMVHAEVINPVEITLASCTMGDNVGYSATAQAYDGLEAYAAQTYGGQQSIKYLMMKSAFVDVTPAGTIIPPTNPAEVIIHWEGASGPSPAISADNSRGYSCTGAACYHNPWGNVEGVYLPGFALNNGGKCPGKWCDASTPPRISDTKPFVYVPITKTQYDAAAAFFSTVQSLPPPAVNPNFYKAAVDYYAQYDARLGRIRQGWLEVSGMGDPSRWNRANTGWSLETAQWKEYNIQCASS